MAWDPEKRIAGGKLGDDQDYTGLPDDEIRRAVLEHLQADQTVDAAEIEVEVEDRRVRLGGRTGSEVERETAERVVRDVIGLELAANAIRVETAAPEGARATGLPNADVAAEALASTDPAHGTVQEDAPAVRGPKRRGRRPARLEEAVARAVREVPEGQMRHAAAENASAFKDRMRAVAEERDRVAAERARGRVQGSGPEERGPGGRRES